MSQHSLSVIIPALNEEQNLPHVLSHVIETLERNTVDWQLILVNDGSTDNTGTIMSEYQRRFPDSIDLISRHHNHGLGYSVKEGMLRAERSIVTWFPADGENDPEDLVRFLPLLDQVDIVIPFAVNKGVRSLPRRILSSLYLIIINMTFGTSFNYTNGSIFYKTDLLRNITAYSNSFFFQTETLIKAVRLENVLFAEVPITLRTRRTGRSKGISIHNFIAVCTDFLKLAFDIHVMDKFR